MSINLYIDYFSQPSRALLAYCIINNIPHTVKQIRLFKGDHLTQQYQKINPFKKVPAIKHQDFVLAESHAIFGYLSSVFPVNSSWYPTDPQTRAKVNCYLHWHHQAVRTSVAGYIFRKYFAPRLTGAPFPEAMEKQILLARSKTLSAIQNFLKQPYVAGTQHPTVADLSCFCQLVQMKLIQFDFSQYPNISRWMTDLERIPGVAQAHEVFYKVLPRFKL